MLPESIEKIRAGYPVLDRKIYGKPLIYLDNTATSQTPRRVVEAVERVYYGYKANVHRGVHTLSQEATEMMETTRRKVAAYINAASAQEVIFTRGTTEAINLVASSYGGEFLRDGDRIILTVMEHHANIVPWQLLQRHKDIHIDVVPVRPDGSLDTGRYRELFTDRTRLVAFCHVSLPQA